MEEVQNREIENFFLKQGALSEQEVKDWLIYQFFQEMDSSQLNFAPLSDIKKRLEQLTVQELQTLLDNKIAENRQVESVSSEIKI